MRPAVRLSRRAGAGAALLTVLAAAVNLRLAIVGVTPLLPDLQRDTGMSSVAAGLVTTIPFLCMSAFAFLGAALVGRIGHQHLITGCLALLGVSTVLRGLMPTGWLVLLLTVPIGVAIALIGVALPSVVKSQFPDRGGTATGGYVVAMKAGGAAASLAAVPLAQAFGGWRAAFALSGVPALLAVALWRRARFRGLPRPSRHVSVAPPRWRTALLLAAVFGTQSLAFTSVITWVAFLYRDAGWSEHLAGSTPGFISIVSIPLALVIPALSDGRDRRGWLFGCVLVMTVGTLGLALAPAALGWGWLTLFALGSGAAFPISLTLPLDVAADASEAGRFATWTLGLGCALSAAGPVVVGLLRDVSGGFVLPFVLVAVVGSLAGLLGLLVRPVRLAASDEEIEGLAGSA